MRIIAGGKRMNRMLMRGAQIGTAGSGVAAVGAMDTQYTIANVWDGFPSKPARWAANAGAEGLTWDARLVSNGDFETAFVGGLPAATASSGWGKTAGATLTRNTTDPRTGAGALQVAGIPGEYAYIDVYCSPGDKLQVVVAARKNTVGGSNARLEVQNLATGKWLTSGAAWQVAETSVVTTASNAYNVATVPFQVESYALCQTLDVVLRFYLFAGGSTTDNLYDDFQVLPGIDVCSIHAAGVTYTLAGLLVAGSLNTATTIELRTGTDGVTYATVVATMTARLQSFYSLFTITYAPFWKLSLGSAQPIPFAATNLFVYLGEVVFGQTLTLSSKAPAPLGVSHQDPQQESDSAYGESRSTILTAGPRRNLTLNFFYGGEAVYQEAKNQVFRLTRNGAYAMVVIVDDTNVDLALFGSVAGDTFDVTRKDGSGGIYTAAMHFNESPMPQWIS